jgi:type II secretory pathway component GspD/PulD (secretin)
MNALRTGLPWKEQLFIVGVVLLGVTASACAVEPGKGSTRVELPKSVDKPRIKFEMDKKSWKEVLAWLADKYDLPLTTHDYPKGTFTFIAPKGKSYTLPEIVDILNEALLTEDATNKYVIVRREWSLGLVPLDQKEKIDPAILPRVKADDLDGHGLTELAYMELRLKSLVAEDLAKELNPIMGSFGSVKSVPLANKLILQDTVRNLKRVLELVESADKDTNEGTYAHTCKYLKARVAEKILKDQLGDPLAEQVRVQGGRPAGFGPGAFPGDGLPPDNIAAGADASGGRGRQGKQEAKVRVHRISSDDATNKVLVTGPADILARAEDIIKKMDVEQPGRSPILVGPPRFEKYAVPSRNAEALARSLKDAYKESANLRISSVGNDVLLVFAIPDDQFEIAKMIGEFNQRKAEAEVVELGVNLEAVDVAATLQGMFGTDSKAGAPFVKADIDRNTIIIHGTKDQVDEIKAVIRSLGAASSTPGGGASGAVSYRVFKLDHGGAAALADLLKNSLPNMGNRNPVKLINPNEVKEPDPSK